MVNERRIEEKLEKIAEAIERAATECGSDGDDLFHQVGCLMTAIEQLAGCVRLLLDAMKQREAAEQPTKGKTKKISTMMY